MAPHDPRHRSFPPAVTSRVRILVLGSLPGAESLARQAYYAHPRNRFWPLAEALFGVPLESPYPARLAALNEAGVGLWDVLGRAARKGSLDADIDHRTEEPNDVAGLLRAHPRIATVALNGRKAEAAFARWILPSLPSEQAGRLAVHALPSTSPANARFRLPDLLDAWGVLKEAADNPYVPRPGSQP